MTKEEFSKKIDHIKADIIGKMSAVDISIGYVISFYVNKNEADIIMFLCNKVPIKEKKKVLEYILNSHKELSILSYPKLIDDIESLQRVRSELAHSMFIIPEKSNYSIVKHVDFFTSNKLGVAKGRFQLKDYKVIDEKLKKVLMILLIIKNFINGKGDSAQVSPAS